MKIPDKIRINGIEYKVEQVPNLHSTTAVLYGQIDHEQSVLELNSENQAHQWMCVTLWHEILHAIVAYSNLDLGDKEENIVDVFAHGIYQVLQDNGEKLFDLAPMGDANEGS